MLRTKTCAAMALTVALGAMPALAQQADHQRHHPGTAAGAASGATPQGGTEGTTAASGGMPMMGMMGQGMMGAGMGRMGMMSDQTGHIEGRIAFLKAELKITDAQLPLWNAVAAAMRENAKTTHAMPGGMMGTTSQPATLPDRLATREKSLTAQLEATRKLKAAVEPLYAALSDEQKKTADALTGGQGGMMGGGMMGMMRGGMMGQGMMGHGMMGSGMQGSMPNQGGSAQEREHGGR